MDEKNAARETKRAKPDWIHFDGWVPRELVGQVRDLQAECRNAESAEDDAGEAYAGVAVLRLPAAFTMLCGQLGMDPCAVLRQFIADSAGLDAGGGPQQQAMAYGYLERLAGIEGA